MPDLFDLPFDDPPPQRPASGRPLTVSEVTAGLRHAIEQAFDTLVVEGEISNCRQWSSGHLYFTLKDDRAQLRAVMFRTAVRTLRFRPEDGMHVVARGRLGVYDAKGEYQIVCEALDPLGLGALQAAFEQLKRRLGAEGLFDQARKRPLPVLPRRIGVVTSADGAALGDILRVLTRRHPSARILIRPARVQGEGAADDLIRGLAALGKIPDVDVIIIGRGGGSSEDLWAFNDERLARAIAAAPVPVIAAVGHEADFTIADFVADVRAATPSNAAELVVDRADAFVRRIDTAADRLSALARLRLGRDRQRAERLATRLRQWTARVVLGERDARQLTDRLARAMRQRVQRVAETHDRLGRRLEARDVRRMLGRQRVRLAAVDGRLREHVAGRPLRARARVVALAAQLDALSPLAVLGRGYALCWNEAGDAIIRSSHAVRPGARVRVRLAEGELGCRVETATPSAQDGTRHDV